MLTRRPWQTAAAVWAAWAAVVVVLVVVASKAGAYPNTGNWLEHGGPLWPLFTWDYGWYEVIGGCTGFSVLRT